MSKIAVAALIAAGAISLLSLPARAAETPSAAHADLKAEDAKIQKKEKLEKSDREARAEDKQKEAAALKAGNKAEAEKYSKEAHERLEKEHQDKADIVADKARRTKDKAESHSGKN